MARNSLIFIALFYVGFSTLFGQNFNPSKAEELRASGDLKGAIAERQARFSENPHDYDNAYRLAALFSLDRKRDSAFYYLDYALRGDTSVQVLSDPDFYFLVEDARWNDLEARQIEKVEAKYGSYPFPDRSKKLWRMSMKDQAYYYHIEVAEKQLPKGSPVLRALWDLKEKLNAENLRELEAMIEAHGWPTLSDVKGSAAQAAFLIIQHADLEVQEKYLPFLKAAVEKNEADPGALALLTDRIRIRKDQPQLYGSQVRRNPETGAFEPFPIEDEAHVDARRKAVGLPPLAEYLAHWGIEYTPPGK